MCKDVKRFEANIKKNLAAPTMRGVEEENSRAYFLNDNLLISLRNCVNFRVAVINLVNHWN